MASRYWVGGSATWDGTAGTKWALTSGGAGGQAVPTASDDVFFDAASGAVTVSWTVTQDIFSLDCTGFTGTLNGGAGNPLRFRTNFKLVSGMTVTNVPAIWVGTGPSSLTTAGKTLYSLEVGGTFGQLLSLVDALTVGNLVCKSGNLGLKSGATSTATTVTDNTVSPVNFLLSASSPSAATLSVASGNVNLRYATISYSTATGGATFTAGPGATNGGNNTGWTFLSGGTPLFELGAF